MTATATNKPAPPKTLVTPRPEFEMPRPFLTQSVIWYPDVDDATVESGRAAIVTEVGEENISVAILFPGHIALEPKQAVRHVKDPNKESARNVNQGVWDFARIQDLEDGRYRAMTEQRIEQLETKVREFEKAKATASAETAKV